MRRLIALTLVITGCASTPSRHHDLDSDRFDSGGVLLPEQASYDVTSYDLAIEIFPEKKAIQGTLTVHARIGAPLKHFVLDLDTALQIESVTLRPEGESGEALDFERRGGRVWIALPVTGQPGESVAIEIVYGGEPHVARMPPWSGGFIWSETPDGEPWIATTCQGEGADLWWPVKDHVSDEPDSMTLRVTVPKPLVVASNGRLRKTEDLGDGRRTFHWFISNPINCYNVALNIAAYRTIEETFTSVAGGTFPVVFYVLPSDFEKGEKLMPEILDHLKFYESTIGPYPFRAEKYGVVQTPHLGMEHQTIIAYGGKFENGAMTGGEDFDFDVLHHHELSHEWWGNLVTNMNWNDMWLHEGFGTYMQPLYLEKRQGVERYHAYLASIRGRIRNRKPVAPRAIQSAKEASNSDIYFKGAWTLHTLRYLVGDEKFFVMLRRMAYPTPEWETRTDGSQCRFAVTEDFIQLAKQVAGRELDWFFEVYLRRAALPRLEVESADGRLELRWKTPDDLPFPMPIDIQLGEERKRVELPDGRAIIIAVPEGVTPQIDPEDWVLRE